MFCPKCKAEYREGFYVCADCNVDLVEEVPPEPVPEYLEYEQVLATYNAADIAIIKSLLDTYGIMYYFHGEHFTYVRPLADPARLMVNKDEVGLTRDLLRHLNLSFVGPNLQQEPEH
jgi:hypothetical protein